MCNNIPLSAGGRPSLYVISTSSKTSSPVEGHEGGGDIWGMEWGGSWGRLEYSFTLSTLVSLLSASVKLIVLKLRLITNCTAHITQSPAEPGAIAPLAAHTSMAAPRATTAPRASKRSA